jgi:hypothetical protein
MEDEMSIDVIKLAEQSGLRVATNASGVQLVGYADHFGSGDGLLCHLTADDMARFAALVLEEAAQLAERTSKMSAYFAGEAVQDHIAAVIRALKPQE